MDKPLPEPLGRTEIAAILIACALQVVGTALLLADVLAP